jgi:hypothetical protein
MVFISMYYIITGTPFFSLSSLPDYSFVFIGSNIFHYIVIGLIAVIIVAIICLVIKEEYQIFFLLVWIIIYYSPGIFQVIAHIFMNIEDYIYYFPSIVHISFDIIAISILFIILLIHHFKIKKPFSKLKEKKINMTF